MKTVRSTVGCSGVGNLVALSLLAFLVMACGGTGYNKDYPEPSSSPSLISIEYKNATPGAIECSAYIYIAGQPELHLAEESTTVELEAGDYRVQVEGRCVCTDPGCSQAVWNTANPQFSMWSVSGSGNIHKFEEYQLDLTVRVGDAGRISEVQ